ncbi:sigma-70 family RNA polymerase sigma factor [Pseudonocardiaceae bacterium YIM PH 21723]|nr:sigma-70 family RNA polymerase sigma factor [Pseudonocardiaceae bacterium YIM PH 21723]
MGVDKLPAVPSPREDDSLPSDEQILADVRAGDLSGVGLLYSRHSAAALRFCLRYSQTRTDAEDLVAEGFAAVLEALRRGKGPVDGFRVYLLVAIRNLIYRRSAHQELAAGEDLDGTGQLMSAGGQEASDPSTRVAERRLLAKAFAELPERWRAVLWHIEVEGESPKMLAAQFGLKPNGVSALAYRARNALRRAYLMAHVNGHAEPSCRKLADSLVNTLLDSKLSPKNEINSHLRDCPGCRSLSKELTALGSRMRVQLSALILGGTAAAAYLRGNEQNVSTTAYWMAQYVRVPSWITQASDHTMMLMQRGSATVAAGTVAVTIGLFSLGPPDGTTEVLGAPPSADPPNARYHGSTPRSAITSDGKVLLPGGSTTGGTTTSGDPAATTSKGPSSSDGGVGGTGVSTSPLPFTSGGSAPPPAGPTGGGTPPPHTPEACTLPNLPPSTTTTAPTTTSTPVPSPTTSPKPPVEECD